MKFWKRLFERRASIKNPPDWLYTALTGGDRTVAGVTVGPDTALTLSSYYAAIRNISEDVGKLPLILYKHLDPRGKQRMSGHPLYRLLHDAPNGEMSSMAFRETLTLHAIGWGNGYAEIVRDKSKRAVALWPMDPARVSVERDNRKQIRYIVRPGPGETEETTFDPMDVFHLHGLGFDGITGYSVAHLARECIGAALAAEKSGATLFGNGSRPGGVLQLAHGLSPEAKAELRRSWEAAHGGVDRANKTAILEDGITFQPIAVPNKDAQWIEARQFHVAELSRWLRIPPHKIGDLTRATFSNIEQQSIEYVVDCLQPWLVRWEQEIARKVIPARSQMFAEHLLDGLLRGDTETRYSAYRTAILSGWMSRNEARSLENMNPEDGLDRFLEPLNTGPVDGGSVAA
jgi:HK97 family phage portal protein